MSKRTFATGLAKYAFNPLVRFLFRLGVPVPGTALLETVGRRSGQLRQNPVTDGLDGDVFWIVAEHGRRAAYVRNIEANPRVRVRIGRQWLTGSARTLPDEDPRERLDAIARTRRRSRLNLATVRLMGTDLLVVRVDLDPLRT